MSCLEHNDTCVDIDQDGFLTDFDAWDETVACTLAAKEGVSETCPLTKERMDILRYVRNYYKEFEAFPIVRAVCKNVGQSKDCQYTEFPDPIVAWKIAGLPKPNPEVLAKIRQL